MGKNFYFIIDYFVRFFIKIFNFKNMVFQIFLRNGVYFIVFVFVFVNVINDYIYRDGMYVM